MQVDIDVEHSPASLQYYHLFLFPIAPPEHYTPWLCLLSPATFTAAPGPRVFAPTALA
jgi:hypothetical protein